MSAITISGRRGAGQDGSSGRWSRIGRFGSSGSASGSDSASGSASASDGAGEATFVTGARAEPATPVEPATPEAIAEITEAESEGFELGFAVGLELKRAAAYTYLPDRAQFVMGPSLADQLTAGMARVWAMVRRWDKTTRLLAGSAVALVPWIIVLGLTLPTHTVARNWSTVWIGFDLLLAVAFGVTARLYLRNDPRVGIMSAVVATLLIVDCWFDTSTASNGQDAIESWVLAVFVEIPIAIFCARLAWRSSLTMITPPMDEPILSPEPADLSELASLAE